MTNGPVSFLCLLRQVSSVLSRKPGNKGRPHLDEDQFVTTYFMAGELHGPGGRVSLSAT